MEAILAELGWPVLMAAMGVALLAGAVKGVVGFSMPTVMISGLTIFVSPDLALAGLILPTLVTNGWQALRRGRRAAWETVKRFRVFLISGGVCLIAAAQLVAVVSHQALFLMIGLPVLGFALAQLAGWRPKVRPTPRIEAAVGAFTGTVGGMSGVWGAPTVTYLTAIDTAKSDQMRIQGVIYGLGAVALTGAHIQSGILSASTAPFSLAIVPAALIGMWLGFQVSDRVNQTVFRTATLVVLVVAGANLVRRGLLG